MLAFHILDLRQLRRVIKTVVPQQLHPFDGLFVLRTDTDHDAETVANVYKTLWMPRTRSAQPRVSWRRARFTTNAMRRSRARVLFVSGSLPEAGTRTAPGAKGLAAAWAEVIRGLDNLQQVEVILQGSRFLLRGEIKGMLRRQFAPPRRLSRGPAGTCLIRGQGKM